MGPILLESRVRSNKEWVEVFTLFLLDQKITLIEQKFCKPITSWWEHEAFLKKTLLYILKRRRRKKCLSWCGRAKWKFKIGLEVKSRSGVWGSPRNVENQILYEKIMSIGMKPELKDIWWTWGISCSAGKLQGLRKEM